VLDRLVTRLKEACEYNANAVVAPVALLWPDESAQWLPVVRRVSQRIPVVTLGTYDVDQRQGPAHWIRCVVARSSEAGLSEGPPIVYLPGVARSKIRAVDSCPPELAPIAELQYRSQEFTQPRSRREWSVRGFLASREHGLGLNIPDGRETSAALRLALDELLDERIDRLSGQVLDADFLNDLVNPDPTNILLGWLSDPIGYRGRLNDAQWAAFMQQCVVDWNFHPEKDGPITAARMLGERKGGWAKVWERFADTPERYVGLPDRLRIAKPMELSFEAVDAWPQDNRASEDLLRSLLREFAALTSDGAREAAGRLDADHAWRRRTPWAKLGMAPLAFALEHLDRLAEFTAVRSGAADFDVLVEAYVERGWEADDAALRALAAAPAPGDREAVTAAVTAIYRPWLDASATALQAAVGSLAHARIYHAGPPARAGAGSVTLFVDGLRLDVGHRLADRLAGGSVKVELTTSLAALPTVTETAKPALMPVGSGVLGAGPDLHSASTATGTRASLQVLRSLMGDVGVQILSPTETGDPSGTAWTEAGELDHHGHDVGVRLVDYLEDEVSRVATRVRELIDVGWRSVQVVTDHGWILLPMAMERIELPAATTQIKKGRCARLKEGAVVDVPTVPWFWDQDVRIALAPGVTCFEAGKQYEHGGMSLQECVVPRLTVTVDQGGGAKTGLEITKVTWLGLLCRIELNGTHPGVLVDLRALPADPKTSIAEQARGTTGVGKVALLVSDEELEGQHAHLVLVAPDGEILVQRDVVVGRNR
jgi:hypothetical protein